MKKLLCLIALFCCLNIGQAKAGVIVMDTVEPLLISGAEVKNVKDLKVGSERIISILGLFTTGYAGIYQIAALNDISKVHHVDVKKKMLFGIGTITVMVYGE